MKVIDKGNQTLLACATIQTNVSSSEGECDGPNAIGCCTAIRWQRRCREFRSISGENRFYRRST